MSEEQVALLLGSLRRLRDRAMMLLMLQGGLRPGEVLTLQLDDIQYGHRRIVVRYRTTHPKGVRTKSRRERVVDLHEPETLHTVSAYVMQERPVDADTPFVFLVGGRGLKRREPLGYDALVRLFARHCERVGIGAPWVTPHALRPSGTRTPRDCGRAECVNSPCSDGWGIPPRTRHACTRASRTRR